MADISKELAELKYLSTDGKRARTLISDIANNINTNGTSATTLNGKSAEDFTSRSDFEFIMKRYIYSCGLVHDFINKKDQNGDPIAITTHYTDKTLVNTSGNGNPIDKSKNEVAGDINSNVLKNSNSYYIFPTGHLSNDASTAYSMTLATAGAVYELLGYSELSDLQEYIDS